VLSFLKKGDGHKFLRWAFLLGNERGDGKSALRKEWRSIQHYFTWVFWLCIVIYLSYLNRCNLNVSLSERVLRGDMNVHGAENVNKSRRDAFGV
jgi:hypothetical protein